MIAISREDAIKAVHFLDTYVIRLRSTGSATDNYRADAIEDLAQRIATTLQQ